MCIYREVVAVRMFRRRPIRDAMRIASTFGLNLAQRVYFGSKSLFRSRLWTMARRLSPRPLTLITVYYMMNAETPTKLHMLGLISFLGLRCLDYHHRYLCRPLSVLLCALATLHTDYSPMTCAVIFVFPSFPRKKQALCASCHKTPAWSNKEFEGLCKACYSLRKCRACDAVDHGKQPRQCKACKPRFARWCKTCHDLDELKKALCWKCASPPELSKRQDGVCWSCEVTPAQTETRFHGLCKRCSTDRHCRACGEDNLDPGLNNQCERCKVRLALWCQSCFPEDVKEALCARCVWAKSTSSRRKDGLCASCYDGERGESCRRMHADTMWCRSCTTARTCNHGLAGGPVARQNLRYPDWCVACEAHLAAWCEQCYPPEDLQKKLCSSCQGGAKCVICGPRGGEDVLAKMTCCVDSCSGALVVCAACLKVGDDARLLCSEHWGTTGVPVHVFWL